jgi:hypothetical protein
MQQFKWKYLLDPDYPWEAYLQSQKKVGKSGRKEPACMDEVPYRLRSIAERLKTPPTHIYPAIPPTPRWKAPQNNLKMLWKKSLTHNSPFAIFSPP